MTIFEKCNIMFASVAMLAFILQSNPCRSNSFSRSGFQYQHESNSILVETRSHWSHFHQPRTLDTAHLPSHSPAVIGHWLKPLHYYWMILENLGTAYSGWFFPNFKYKIIIELRRGFQSWSSLLNALFRHSVLFLFLTEHGLRICRLCGKKMWNVRPGSCEWNSTLFIKLPSP